MLRLSQSTHGKEFIFKGGFLLAYLMEIGRETVDLDFLLTQMDISENEMKKAMMNIIETKSTDGFLFHFEGKDLLEQPHMQYPGYRISFNVTFGQIQTCIQSQDYVIIEI